MSKGMKSANGGAYGWTGELPTVDGTFVFVTHSLGPPTG